MSDPVDIEQLRRDYMADLRATPKPPVPSGAQRAKREHPENLTENDLEVLLVDADTFAEAARLLLDLLVSPDASTALRLTALRRLSGSTFAPTDFAPFHAEFVNVLRRLAVDEAADLRLAALDRLSLMADSEAQSMLRASLEGTGPLLVPAATAVRFLARDDHGGAMPLFRELARTGPVRSREQAIRALASDPESVELLAAIAADKSERPAVRELAAMSLKAASPARFAEVARAFVLDADEDDRLRAAALTSIEHSSEVAAALDREAFADELRKTEADTTSRVLKSSMKRMSDGPPSGAE